MEIWLDDRMAEQQFREIILRLQRYKSGEVADNMKLHGAVYKMNWGVPLVSLREIAREYNSSHVLALKLWNRQWRETMILATLLDKPDQVTEQQMDYWTRSFENAEMAEQASANLWWRTPFAYAKAMEWCRGKKHWIRYTAVHLTGRLALADKKSPDEMFDPFWEEFTPLARDPNLSSVLYRTVIIMANRSEYLHGMTKEWIISLMGDNSPNTLQLAGELEKGITFS